VNRGEVWWIEHPEAGRRPACVLTRQAAIAVLNSVLVAPATRTVRGIPTEVALTRQDGMPEDCALSSTTTTGSAPTPAGNVSASVRVVSASVRTSSPVPHRARRQPGGKEADRVGSPLRELRSLTWRRGRAGDTRMPVRGRLSIRSDAHEGTSGGASAPGPNARRAGYSVGTRGCRGVPIGAAGCGLRIHCLCSHFRPVAGVRGIARPPW
jgi:mRNA-degrading endonuclease toxin of MazEF toxin-antitoxin module